MLAMSKEKKKNDPQPDRHKSKNMIRLSKVIHEQMKKLADINDRPMSREIRKALIAHLEKNGMWPPAGQEPEAEE